MTEPSGAPVRRRPTLADVAAHAGVSVPLVSIVMRDVPGASAVNREKVRRAAEQLGYRPDSRARMLRRTRSRLIGVVFGVQHAFHGDLVSGLYAAADRIDYELTLSAVTPGRDEHRAITSLLQDRCEALILLGPQVPTPYLADLATRMPVVVVARAVRSRAVDVVRTDDAAGLHQAVDHLVDLGHTQIAHIDGGRAPGTAERRRGYREALQRHNLADATCILPGGLTEDDGAAAARGPSQRQSPAHRRHRLQRPLRHRRPRCSLACRPSRTPRPIGRRVRRQPPRAPIAHRPHHDRPRRPTDHHSGHHPRHRPARRHSCFRSRTGHPTPPRDAQHHRTTGQIDHQLSSHRSRADPEMIRQLAPCPMHSSPPRVRD